EFQDGMTILDAARKVQIDIPTLCKHPDVLASGACGICIVKMKVHPACCSIQMTRPAAHNHNGSGSGGES
ncbi:MAG: 2Fe-2S iron-sulfur cluster binding domain-containing protein, partial [Candidatus Omnitrophica bacterium]|nr:2Fe-2S iron-sulfur cluster binding domain-containing protein [Candidatus Omnitrophota bacterium]